MAIANGSKQGPTIAPNITVAPTRDAGKGYGANQFSGRSSDNPGDRTVSPLARDLESRDPVLAIVRERGSAKNDVPNNFQLRTEADRPYPNSMGMKHNFSADDRVPGAVEWNGGEPVRKPVSDK